jgi:hypothetical protein
VTGRLDSAMAYATKSPVVRGSRRTRNDYGVWCDLRDDASLAVIEALEIAQGGVCAICGGGRLPNARQLSVDHDHACCPPGSYCARCIRALLCNRCNVMLGNAREDPAVLEAGAAYLRRYAEGLPSRG